MDSFTGSRPALGNFSAAQWERAEEVIARLGRKEGDSFSGVGLTFAVRQPIFSAVVPDISRAASDAASLGLFGPVRQFVVGSSAVDQYVGYLDRAPRQTLDAMRQLANEINAERGLGVAADTIEGIVHPSDSYIHVLLY